jgi:asparagine synthase (glutamine-hydrolysing)
MCGIAGLVDLAGDLEPERAAESVTSMLELVRERGPDAAGAWRGDGVALGHRRLRVIDLSPAADQPFRG